MASRATLRLTLTCNNRCIFCAQEGLAPTIQEPLERRLGALRNEADEITFVGGEPTLDPALPRAIALARAAGFSRIGIQTNGRRLADPAYASVLVDAGLSDVHLSIHGPEAAHDYHTGTPGSYRESLAALTNLRALHRTVVVATVLTRSNYRVLAEMPAVLKRHGVSAWCVDVPRAAGRARAAFDAVLPRLALALPFVLHAMEVARRLSLVAWLRGAPLCLVGPFSSRALPSPRRAYGDVCVTCPLRERCPGVDPAYLARFGGDELVPRAAARPFVDDHPELARMFVGVGELAEPPADGVVAVAAP